jgi:DNA polymerase-3 subunit gamma/tau
MSLTLYRKYRPQLFVDLIGQNHIKITLENEIKSGALAHAYLFSGPRGIGKTTVARLLAKALNCQQRKKGEFEPCDQCLSCQEIKEGKALDVIEIDAASNTQVEKVRDNIIDNVRFTPYRDQYKIFIIDEVHMLSASSFNALLKTMEEPPEHCLFILCTTELHKLPETIISRCQRFDFKRVDAKVLEDHLRRLVKEEGFTVADSVLKNIVSLTGGFVRDALGLLGQILALGKKEIKQTDADLILPRSDFELVGRLVVLLLAKNTKEALALINNLVDEGVDLEHFTADLIEYIRRMIFIKLGAAEDSWQESGLEIYQQVKNTDLARLTQLLNVFLIKYSALKNAEIIQLPLELAVLELCEKGTTEADFFVSEKVAPLAAASQPAKKKEAADKIVPPPAAAASGDVAAAPAPAVATAKAAKKDELFNLNLAEIKERWQEMIATGREVNHSVALALQTACPLALNERTLEIGFEHSFYCERFKQAKSREILEQILKKTFSQDLIVKCGLLSAEKKSEIKRERDKKQAVASEQINQVLEDFGGVMVE